MTNLDWARRLARQCGREFALLYRVLKDPRAPWYVRVIAACSVGYVFSPIQLIPSVIPVIGQLDDAGVLVAGGWLVRSLADPAFVRTHELRLAHTDGAADEHVGRDLATGANHRHFGASLPPLVDNRPAVAPPGLLNNPSS